MAHLSNDHHLVHFFNAMQGSDIYIFMASLCFDCDESDVTKEQRACAKQLSLGILYGMGADNMAKKLTRFTGRTYTMNEASRLISKWKDKVNYTAIPSLSVCTGSLSYSLLCWCGICVFQFSGVARFMQKAKDDALKNHCARTLWGRVRPLPGQTLSQPYFHPVPPARAKNSPMLLFRSALCRNQPRQLTGAVVCRASSSQQRHSRHRRRHGQASDDSHTRRAPPAPH